MIFLAPAVAFGAALAAAPIIIHLLNRRRYKRIPWAAMAFLLEAVVRSRRRLQIEEWLLMLLRAAALVLFALALARPLLNAAGPSRGAEAVILLDKSASMRYSEGAGTLFDFAKARVHEILSGLGAGGSAVLVTFDSAAELPLGIEPSTDLNEIRSCADRATVGWAGTDYNAALAAAAEASKGFPSRAPAVFVVSDFRRGAESVASGVASKLKGRVRLVPVTDSDGDDMGVVGVVPAGQVFTTSADLLAVKVVNSRRTRSTAGVSVSVDGLPPETTPVAVDGQSAANGLISAPALSNLGVHSIVATVPADPYTANDKAYGIIVRRPLKIAGLSAGEAGVFLSAALAAAPQGSFETVNAAVVGSREVNDIDGFVLAGELPTGVRAEAIAKRIRDGAFAAVFVDDPAKAKDFFSAIDAKALAEATAAAGEITGAFHPALSGAHAVTEFINSSPDLSLANVNVKRLADFAPAGEGIVTPMVVETPAGQKAFLAFARVGDGMVAVFNSSLARESGNFAVSPFFVPLLYETLSALVGDPSAGLTVPCGAVATVPATTKSSEVDVEGPEGTLKAALKGTAKGFVYAFVPPSPGFYKVAGVELAANVPASEGMLTLAPRSEIEHAFGGSAVSGDLAAAVEHSARGREISVPLLIAALLALGLEMLLVYVFKRVA